MANVLLYLSLQEWGRQWGGGGNGVGGHWGGGDTAVVRCTPEMTEMCDTVAHHMVVNMTQTHMTG